MTDVPPFSDRLEKKIQKTGSLLVAGLDPDMDSIPHAILDLAAKTSSADEEFFRKSIAEFYLPALEQIADQIAAVKPNLAFFEQYGIGGLLAYNDITAWCRQNDLPVIADAKRGDIGSTAAAYANAFFGPRNFRGRAIDALYADALTINPFLGFDTLEPFLKRAQETGCGLFILVRTSNPGSADLQSVLCERSGQDISALVAQWIQRNSSKLIGNSNLSGLGAVVGATHPGELQRLRTIMPDSFFLVPGYGAQGGSAEAIVPGALPGGQGVIVNSSRGIFGGIPLTSSAAETSALIRERVRDANRALNCIRPAASSASSQQ